MLKNYKIYFEAFIYEHFGIKSKEQKERQAKQKKVGEDTLIKIGKLQKYAKDNSLLTCRFCNLPGGQLIKLKTNKGYGHNTCLQDAIVKIHDRTTNERAKKNTDIIYSYKKPLSKLSIFIKEVLKLNNRGGSESARVRTG